MTLAPAPLAPDQTPVAAPEVPTRTPDDAFALYPADDGEPMAENEFQYLAIVNAVFALKRQVRRLRRRATVRGDCALYYDPDQPQACVVPDVLLAYGVDLASRASYVTWLCGKVPDLVMEIASPSTYRQDLETKHELYEALGIAEYWQYDPQREDPRDPKPPVQLLPAPLMGWRLRGARYEAIPVTYDPGRAAWIAASAVLGTEWGVDAQGDLRLWNAQAGDWYRFDMETEDAWIQAAARAARAAARADQEAARADRAAARADQEAARADQEAVRADRAEAELARLRDLWEKR